MCDVPALSLDWDASGILVAQGAAGIVRCNLAGGAPEQIGKVAEDEIAIGPQILPDRDTLLFTIAKASPGTGARWDQARVVVQSLRTRERKTIVDGGSEARFVASGHLIYAVGGIVFAAPFDLGYRELRGTAVPVIEGVMRGNTGVLQLAVSPAGTLVYMPGPTGDQTLRAISHRRSFRRCHRIPVPNAPYSHVRVSP